jgi:predicted DNA-binding protein (MmcQ/YjbR family)
VTYEDFDRFCASLPATTFVVQWGGAHVWKVGGKVFAIGGWDANGPAFTFKATPVAFEMMKAAPGVRPAPYLASRGMKWLQRVDDSSLSDRDLRGYLQASHRLVVAGLSRRARVALGLAEAASVKPTAAAARASLAGQGEEPRASRPPNKRKAKAARPR